MSSVPLLQLQGVGLDLGGRVILRDLSAAIHKVSRPGQTQGQVVGLLGPSGVGKTSLFKIIAGLQAPTRGTVLVDDPPVPVHRGLVGVVHQDYPLFEHRTVYSNLLLAARQSGCTPAHVVAMLDRFQLRDHWNRYPAELSGGQRQRTAIAQQILCVARGTLVATSDGWKPVEQVCRGDSIGTVLGTGPVTTVERHQCLPVFRVRLSDGAVLRVTEDHQFHAVKKLDRHRSGPAWSLNKIWSQIALKDLAVGDFVRICPAPMPNNGVKDEIPAGFTERDWGFLLGLLLGDGCITHVHVRKNRVYIATDRREAEWNQLIASLLAKIGLSARVYGKRKYENAGNGMALHAPGLSALVRRSALTPGKSPTKRIPPAYLCSNEHLLSGLLDGLFSTDGCVSLVAYHPKISFKTASFGLAQDIRLMLLYFGIHGRIYPVRRGPHNIRGRMLCNGPAWNLVISGVGAKIFAQRIGLSHPRKHALLRDMLLRWNLTGGGWRSRIEEIAPDGTAEVFDLKESDSDTWITEGVVSRGCGSHVLLLDEPFSGLDLVMEDEVCHLIAELAQADAMNTVIVVTHDITAAATVADTLWLMGRERDPQGQVIPGARIVETYDLVERGLAWHPDIVLTKEFGEFIREVKARFRTL